MVYHDAITTTFRDDMLAVRNHIYHVLYYKYNRIFISNILYDYPNRIINYIKNKNFDSNKDLIINIDPSIITEELSDFEVISLRY